MSQPFKVNDVVHHKLDSEPMTIVKIEERDGKQYAECQWSSDEKPETKWFDCDDLTPVGSIGSSQLTMWRRHGRR